MKTILIEWLSYKGQVHLKLRFEYDLALITTAKKLGAKWSASYRTWHVEYTPELLTEIHRLFNGVVLLDVSLLTTANKPTIAITLPKLPEEREQKVLKFINWLRSKRYSDATIATYSETLRLFLRFTAHKSIAEITHDDVVDFNTNYILDRGLSASYQNQFVNAIKLFFSLIENVAMDVTLVHRPKKPKLLPNVLSKEEVKRILQAHSNIKHKAMLSLIYSCGLRCSELLNLKPEHIDSKRSILIIKQAKGRKDRIAPLSSKIVLLLREYFIANRPSTYLFEGQVTGRPYDSRSLQLVLKQALHKTGITKPVSLHWLRHSYATHLLENGTDLRYIQEILGHNSSKTTEIYTHVSTKNIQKIISPFDYL